MSRPKPPFEGACLCGAVRVHIRASPLLTLACHCRDCQKLTASAFSLTTMFPNDGFSCSGAVFKGGRRSRDRDHYFCKSCGNFIYSQIGGSGQRVNLRSSILDEAAAFAPFVELMTEEKLPWARVPAKHSYRRFPQRLEELQALMAAYQSA